MAHRFLGYWLLPALLLITACGAVAPAPPAATPAPAAGAPARTSYPVTDAASRQVTLDTAPRRILSLSPGVTEIIWALGQGGLQVGRTNYDD